MSVVATIWRLRAQRSPSSCPVLTMSYPVLWHSVCSSTRKEHDLLQSSATALRESSPWRNMDRRPRRKSRRRCTSSREGSSRVEQNQRRKSQIRSRPSRLAFPKPERRGPRFPRRRAEASVGSPTSRATGSLRELLLEARLDDLLDTSVQGSSEQSRQRGDISAGVDVLLVHRH